MARWYGAVVVIQLGLFVEELADPYHREAVVAEFVRLERIAVHKVR